MTQADFTKVNSADCTCTWKNDILVCTRQPDKVMRPQKSYRNFELVIEWNHPKPAKLP